MSTDQKRLDNYKPLKFFQEHAPTTNTGFAKFEDGDAYYFCYFFGGKIVLLSEAYTGEPGRDNGVESVKKNMKLEERYRFHEHENGKYYFDLIAGNYQEIATSVWFGSEKAAKEMANIFTGGGQASDSEIDNYHPLAFFEQRISGVKDGFDTFEAEDGHYFTYNRGGEIVLISEGYTSAAGRDNGIESVKKNMTLEERYDFRTLKNGQHDFKLMAGNNQEIARSIWYGSAAAAAAGAAYLMGKNADRDVDDYHPLAFYEARISGVKTGFDTFEADDGHYFTYNRDGKIVLLSEAYTSAAGRDNGIESVKKNMKLEERYDYRALKNGQHDYRIKAGNNQEIARSVWYGSAAAATAGAAYLLGKGASREVDNYHPLAFYESRISGVESGFDTFEAEGGHYFTYNQDGKPLLLSEAYASAAGRNNGIESVRKNMLIEDRYEHRALKNGKHDFKLKAGNNQEIARSVWFGSAGAAAAAAAILMGKRKKAAPVAPVTPAPAAAAAPIASPPAFVTPAPTPAAAAPVVATTAAAPAAIAASRGARGWLRWLLLGLLALLALFLLSKCFAGPEKVTPIAAVTCWDGSEAETREACPVEATYECADESMAVNAEACPVDTRYSCWDGSLADNAAACPPQPGTYSCQDGSAVENAADCPTEFAYFTCWDGDRAKNAAACPPKPTSYTCADGSLVDEAVNCPVAVASYTCWDGSTVESAGACPVRPTTQIVCWDGSNAADESSCPARPVTYSTNLSCTCVGSDAAIFNIPEGVSPKSINRLGTLPEFGSLQGLTPTQFYYELQRRYEENSFDRAYLDYVFRSMGYANGFSDATAADFSEETFDYGVSGLLGFGDSHHYAYSQLNVSDLNDLQSFKITARNGCDVNFMKTCGNYMYVCE